MNPDHYSTRYLGEPVEITTVEGWVISEWFNELHSGRSYGFGPQPLQWSEIDAWSRLTRRRLTHWVIKLLRAIDNTYLNARAEASKEP